MELEELHQQIVDLHEKIKDDSYALYQLMRMYEVMAEERNTPVAFDINIKPLREML